MFRVVYIYIHESLFINTNSIQFREGSERHSLRVKDHSSSGPYSSPGLGVNCSGRSLEGIGSRLVLTGLGEVHQTGIERLKCGSPSY